MNIYYLKERIEIDDFPDDPVINIVKLDYDNNTYQHLIGANDVCASMNTALENYMERVHDHHFSSRITYKFDILTESEAEEYLFIRKL